MNKENKRNLIVAILSLSFSFTRQPSAFRSTKRKRVRRETKRAEPAEKMREIILLSLYLLFLIKSLKQIEARELLQTIFLPLSEGTE